MFNWLELSQGCAKGLLIALNWVFIFIAVCNLGFAVVDMKLLAQYGEEQAGGSARGDVVIIAFSLMLAMLALFGCVACLKNSVKMLYTYVILLISLVVIELLIAIYVSVQRYGLQLRVTDWLRQDFFSNITGDARLEHLQLWDRLQTNYECCGLNGPEDYAAIEQSISLSCCPRAQRARTVKAQEILYKDCLISGSYYLDGCEDEILYILRSDADWLFGVAVVSFWLEAVGMLLAMWVANYIKNSVQVYKHTVKY